MKLRYYCFLLVSTGYWITLYPETNIFLDNLELPEDNAPLTITRQSTPCQILNLVYTQSHLNRILKNDLYTYTYPTGIRNLLTYPSLYTFTPKDSQVNWSIFYQEMPTVFPFANGIGGYVNLFTADYLRDVDIEIARLYNINIPKTIILFQNARVEQRRVGFMFDLWKRFKRVSLGIQFPFYAIERNYNLPLEDQQELQSTIPTITQLASSSSNDDTPTDSKKYIYPYVLETRIGLGDMRLSLGIHVIEKDRGDLIMGAKATLPSEATLTSGFIGSDFSKCLTRKYLDLETFVAEVTETATKDQALVSAKQFGLAGLYQLNETLLGTQLGDFKRTQVALYIQPTLRANNQVSIAATMYANWLLAKRVRRFIKPTVNQADFADQYFDTELFPPAQCDQMSTDALAFLSERLENVLMPPPYTVKLAPQLEIQVTANANIQFTDSWLFVVGYDYWRRHAECARLVMNCDCSQISSNGLQVSTALIPQVSQQKVLLKAEYTKFKVRHNFVFTLGVDLPVSSKNIGDDYTGFIRFEWDF